MAKGFFKLTGFDEYLDKIALAGKDVDQAAENAVVAGADVIVEIMLDKVPRDENDLANHIKRTEPKHDGNFVSVEAGVLNADKRTDLYGLVQEFGSSSNKAQPYFRPAVNKGRTKVYKAQRASLEKDGVL